MTTELKLLIANYVVWIITLLLFRKIFKKPLKPYETPKIVDLYIVLILFFIAQLIWIFSHYFNIDTIWIKV